MQKNSFKKISKLNLKKKNFSVFILLASLFLTGCSLAPIKSPPISAYQLDSRYATSPYIYRHQTQTTLLVSEPVADPGYQTDAMIYVMKPYQLRSFSYNRWVSPPSDMLMSVLSTRLRQMNYFKAVVAPPFGGATDYRLDTQLIAFQQEFLNPVSQFHIILQATLIDNHNNKIMASRQFEKIIPAQSNDPYSGVLAANKAVDNLIDQIAQFCVQSSKRGH